MYLFTSPKNKNLTAEICEVFVTSLFSIPVIYQEKICGEWVQTRGYQACVVYMPIPLRVCLAKAPTLRKALLQNYGKPKTPQQPFDILKQETIIGNSMLLVLPIIFSPDTGGACDERNQTTVFDW